VDAFINADGVSGAISEHAINGTAINAGLSQSLLDSHNQSSIAAAPGATPVNIAGIASILVSTVLVVGSVISTIWISVVRVRAVWIVSRVGIISAKVPQVEATIERKTEPNSEIPSRSPAKLLSRGVAALRLTNLHDFFLISHARNFPSECLFLADCEIL